MAPDPIAIESLAALLALDPDVTGVQQHDAGTWDERTEPSLTVYTAPEAAEDLIRRARELAADLGLGVEVERHLPRGLGRDEHADAHASPPSRRTSRAVQPSRVPADVTWAPVEA